jgi:hypothetical protein
MWFTHSGSPAAVQLPEGNEPVGLDLIEEVLGKPPDGGWRDLDLSQVEAHDLAVETIDRLHVARDDGKVMIGHGRTPPR